MRILYIANSRIPTEKAHGLQIMKTIEALLDEGQEVTLLVPRRQNPIKESAEAFYSLRRVPEIKYVPNFYRIFEKRMQWLYFPLERISFSKYAFWYGLFSKADVIYSREITISFFLSLFGKNVMYEDHEPKKSFRIVYNFFLRHIKRKVVVAENLVSLYEKIGVPKNSYIVVPNGVDLTEFNDVHFDRNLWSDLPAKKTVLYVGHFYDWKGVYTLIDAAPVIDANVVLIGGNQNTMPEVEKYLRLKNITNVFLKEFVSHKKVLPLLKSADVLVLPNTAKEERSNLYTTPLKLFEYMAAGRPIVASNIPSFKSFIENERNALLATPDDPESLAECIHKLLTDPALAESLALKASEDVKQYSWGRRARKIIAFLAN